MTISTTIIKVSYSGDGTQTVFPYTFKINAEADIQVIIRASNGTETVKTLTTDYTVSGVGSASGGNVTMVTAPSATETIVIRRDTTQTQTVDLVENDPFTAETVEGAFDKSVAISQELQEEVNRSIKLSRTNTITSTEFTVDAATRANKILAFDANGEIAVTQELGTYTGNWAASTSYSARDIVKDTTTNNIFIANTAHTSSGSLPLTTNTDSAKWDLLVDAASATASASAAATSATNSANSATASANSASAAASSESNAATSESNATTSASNASTSATNASNSATAAANSASAAEAYADNFDDAYLGAKASNPSVDNDGDPLDDGALYFDTTNDVMKVYDLGTTSWLQLTPTVSNQNNINAVNSNSANINTVASDLSGSNNIGAVAGNATNINTVAGLNTEISNLGTSGTVASINTVANNLADINAFANIYLGPSGSAPTQDPDGSALDVGDLYFDTVSQTMKVYSSSGWIPAGSSVNGTSARFTYNITGTPSSVSGSDANGNTLAYDAGFADVYVNGVRMSSSDITISSGTSVVFATALADGDVVDVVAYGTFNVAAIDASNITSGTLNSARLPTIPTTKGGTGLTTIGSAGQALKVNSGGTALEFGDVSVSLSYTKGTFTGDNSTTAFTIDSGRAVDDVLVYVNGFLLTPTSDYTISGTTLTFTTAPATSAEIVVRYLPLNNSGVYTNDTATGDNSTTAFTIDSGRTVEDVIVTVNGVTLVPATDYTISSTTLTFTTAPTTSAEISIRYLRLT
jgi:hypothetical protein